MTNSNKPLALLLCIIMGFIIFQIITFLGVNGVFKNTDIRVWTNSKAVSEIVSKASVFYFGCSHFKVFDNSNVKNANSITNTAHVISNGNKVDKTEGIMSAVVGSSVSTSESAENKKLRHYPGNRRTALVIVAYNRPDYLRRTFISILTALKSPRNNVKVDIVLSQDGFLPILNTVSSEMSSTISAELPGFSFSHIHHTQENRPNDTGYHKLSRHFGWFMNEMFSVKGYDQVIVLEDDLEVSPDFFDYFDATAPLLWTDSSIFCISAWNDNGQADHVKDPKRLFRSDFFPGLGWMLTKELWKEFGDKWPNAFWDDWIRHPNQRLDRVCIRPEISRSYTFGEQGTSNSQFFGQYLRGIKINDEIVDFKSMDMSFLLKENFDKIWMKAINETTIVNSVFQIPADSPINYKLLYNGKNGFIKLAKQLHIMEDEKAGVFRTAYMNVVSVRYRGSQLYIVPKNGPSFIYNN